MYILQEKITPKGAKIVLETDMSSALFGYKDKHSHEKIGYQAARIIVGAALDIVCVWMIIDTIVRSMNN